MCCAFHVPFGVEFAFARSEAAAAAAAGGKAVATPLLFENLSPDYNFIGAAAREAIAAVVPWYRAGRFDRVPADFLNVLVLLLRSYLLWRAFHWRSRLNDEKHRVIGRLAQLSFSSTSVVAKTYLAENPVRTCTLLLGAVLLQTLPTVTTRRARAGATGHRSGLTAAAETCRHRWGGLALLSGSV